MNSEPARLYGVRTLIYGAANGIGEAVARTCVRHGAEVIAADGPASDIETRFKGVAQVMGIAMPMQDEASPRAVVERAAAELGGLDAVIMTYSLQASSPIADADAQQPLQTRLLAELRAAFETALPHLEKSPAGRFIAVAPLRSSWSVEAQALFDEMGTAYGSLLRELAGRSGKLGITVNGIRPGAIMTPESRRIFTGNKALRDHCIEHSAAARLGEALDVAKVALFLASDDATFVSGTTIAVDGGSPV